MNSDERELSRRLEAVKSGRKDPMKEYLAANEAVKKAHTAYKNSRDRQQQPSPSASEQYAKALRELDLCSRVLDITTALKKTA